MFFQQGPQTKFEEPFEHLKKEGVIKGILPTIFLHV